MENAAAVRPKFVVHAMAVGILGRNVPTMRIRKNLLR
jgi:hypothetical protein